MSRNAISQKFQQRPITQSETSFPIVVSLYNLAILITTCYMNNEPCFPLGPISVGKSCSMSKTLNNLFNYRYCK